MMRSNNSIDLSLFLLVAKIGKTRGLKGEFFLRSFAEQPESLKAFSKFYTLSNSTMEEIHFEYIKTSNSNIISKVKDINDIESAQLFGQKDIYILRSELPELEANQAYWFELEGMEVSNLEGVALGRVKAVNNYGASDVLEVKSTLNNNSTILIPYIKNRTIISINKPKNSILVDWQEDY